ncbi:hypothetical protein PR202_ga00474 [Eleusine coracana subsp. coracana]|uniref:Uncharacterized protein n=1 Tax=Eleusine coracana subsp. coracana TaxID=191504 RepID=A0AAV5BGM2_ELECO|nr:hypothetical protein PR202_ga00474 [Eleusine coracana subsp. coracana]
MIRRTSSGSGHSTSSSPPLSPPLPRHREAGLSRALPPCPSLPRCRQAGLPSALPPRPPPPPLRAAAAGARLPPSSPLLSSPLLFASSPPPPSFLCRVAAAQIWCRPQAPLHRGGGPDLATRTATSFGLRFRDELPLHCLRFRRLGCVGPAPRRRVVDTRYVRWIWRAGVLPLG